MAKTVSAAMVRTFGIFDYKGCWGPSDLFSSHSTCHCLGDPSWSTSVCGATATPGSEPPAYSSATLVPETWADESSHGAEA